MSTWTVGAIIEHKASGKTYKIMDATENWFGYKRYQGGRVSGPYRGAQGVERDNFAPGVINGH